MPSIGQGGPCSPLREEWPAAVVVLEARTRFVPPETLRAALTQMGRHSQRIRRARATIVVWLVMAIDRVTFDIPDTPGNVAAFGRPKTRRYGEAVDGGYPQIHAIFLSETGNRINPRVVKKKMSNFAKKCLEHYHIQHPQTSFEQAVRVLQ